MISWKNIFTTENFENNHAKIGRICMDKDEQINVDVMVVDIWKTCNIFSFSYSVSKGLSLQSRSIHVLMIGWFFFFWGGCNQGR